MGLEIQMKTIITSLRNKEILQKNNCQFQSVMDLNSDCRKRKGGGPYGGQYGEGLSSNYKALMRKSSSM